MGLKQHIVFGLSAGIYATCIGLPAASVAEEIQYSTRHVIEAGDSDAVIAEKAGKVLPRPYQSAWMRLEQTYFIHFGPNTFRGVEWGNGRESPSIFNPTELDADQWVRTIKNAGGKMVILVAKHHEGMSLWPTRYSDHSVASSPWRGGKGDLVKEVADAARKHGIKLGIYLSPADLWQLKTNPLNAAGYYGNGSPKIKSVIPTDPSFFTSDPSKGRAAASGFESYSYSVNDYNRYFLNQLYELLTEYGPVDEVWFDGANPDHSVSEAYDYSAWYDLIRKLQPQAVIFGKGPDARWVGNEGGVGRTTEWSVIPLPTAHENFNWPDLTDYDLGSRAKLQPGSHLWWYPAEVNTPILHGWFWARGKPVKTAAELIDVYYQSVGRNGNMLLNLSPDTRGLIPDDQLANLNLMAQVNRETFARDFAAGATLTADTSNPKNGPGMALDGNLDSWWEAAPGVKQATLILKLPSERSFDVISLQEAVSQRGQRIEAFEVDVWTGGQWQKAEAQTTIGYKRLLRLNAPVRTDQVRIRILSARMEPTLAEIALFKQGELLKPPAISHRSAQGMVSLSCAGNMRVVYTTDGTTPTTKSRIYETPIPMLTGGNLNAACLGADGRMGMISSKRIPGYAPIGWSVVSSEDAGKNPSNVIDGDPNTLWEAESVTFPYSLTVDMKSPRQLGGFFYLPRQGAPTDGLIETYRFETSMDGKTWNTVIPEGRFDNIRNNPIRQEVSFSPISARFFRFTALKEVDGRGKLTAAEIGALPVELVEPGT